MQQRRPTMQSIADKLGISKNSVYLALNSKTGVSEALRGKVMETAREMGYGVFTEREIGRKSRCLMAVIPEYLQNDAFFYYDIIWSIEAEAARHGLLVLKHIVTDAAQTALAPPALPEDMGAIGFLVVGVLSEAYVSMLYHTGMPVVTVDIPYYDAPVSCVCSANHAGGYAAASYLIKRGHKEIGFIGPVYAARSVYERWSGFRQALEEAGYPQDSQYSITGQPGRFELFDTPEALAPQYDKLKKLPTAWFCAGDRIAIAMMNLLTIHNYNVPRDISIIGFDDLSVSQMILPRLTTLHVRRKHMGQLAVQHLLRCVESHQTLMYIALPCKLVERDSVRTLHPALMEGEETV